MRYSTLYQFSSNKGVDHISGTHFFRFVDSHYTFEHTHDIIQLLYDVSKFPRRESSVRCGATRDTDFVAFDVIPFVTTLSKKYRVERVDV